jgi:hypothetical protein
MTNPNLTHIYFLLDRSGSMQAIKEDTEGGFDAFVAEQRRAPGECRVTLAQFDTHYDEVYADRPIADVPPLHLQPRGMTALLDSVGRLVTTAGQRLGALPEHERPGTVIVGVMTDGMENSSKEWTHDSVRALVEQQTQTYSWEFLYMGADQDAVEVGASIGVPRANSMTYGRGRVREAIGAMAGNVAAVRHAMASGESHAAARSRIVFTDDQRERSRE